MLKKITPRRNMRFAIAFLMCCGVSVAQTTDVKGDWVVTVVRFGEPDYTRLNLESKNGHYIGKIWGDVNWLASSRVPLSSFNALIKKKTNKRNRVATCPSLHSKTRCTVRASFSTSPPASQRSVIPR
jgi:hypothetical protein